MQKAPKSNPETIHPFERILANAAISICLVITVILWWSVSRLQSMWPLPGLYFIEMAALSVACAWAFIHGNPRGKWITWGAAGIIGAFSIVGAFSVGFFYLPVALIFGGIAIASDIRYKQKIGLHIGIFIIGGIVQAALMFVAIRLLYPSTGF